MRKRQSSMTATGIAIVRAIESERPPGERICYDPYARRMVNGALYHFVRFFDRLGYSEMRGPGVMGFLAVRERHIDEFLKTQLVGGLDQLVILGAGLDMRAFRFPELERRTRVFEVDHPASQTAKIRKLRMIFGELPPHVTFVPIDFNTQTLAGQLAPQGFDVGCKTRFIWQGVTEYLASEAVDSTLEFIAAHAGPASSVIFDYMYTALLDGTVKRGEVAKMRRDRWMSGEELVFGIPVGTVGEFLARRGFTDVHDADAKFLHQTYFRGVNETRTVSNGYAIASAFVRGGVQTP
jgi:methyltransferase (TIGR00027 family)